MPNYWKWESMEKIARMPPRMRGKSSKTSWVGEDGQQGKAFMRGKHLSPRVPHADPEIWYVMRLGERKRIKDYLRFSGCTNKNLQFADLMLEIDRRGWPYMWVPLSPAGDLWELRTAGVRGLTHCAGVVGRGYGDHWSWVANDRPPSRRLSDQGRSSSLEGGMESVQSALAKVGFPERLLPTIVGVDARLLRLAAKAA